MVTISESKNITRRKDFIYTVRISISASRLSIQTECRSSSGWANQNRTSVAARDSKVTIEICSLFRSRVDRDSFVNRERTKILNLSRNTFHTRPLFREVGGMSTRIWIKAFTRLTSKKRRGEKRQRAGKASSSTGLDAVKKDNERGRRDER